ncbi:MAG: ATP-binding cassette domain-containing protein [Alphaproteobacteria bacterium]
MSGRVNFLWVLIPTAFLAVAPLVLGSFTLTLLNYVGVYALVALGLVIMTGVGGITSFGQAAFVGISAYTTAWLTTTQGLSPWLGLVAAIALTGAVAAILGAVTLRLGGHYLPLSTIAWGIAIFYLFGNMNMLGRHNGISGIPPVEIGPISFVKTGSVYYLIWFVVAIAVFLCRNLLDSREGRAVRSLRGGTVMAESLGIDAFRMRLVTFVLAGLLAAVSGWLYAHMQRFVSPAPFDIKPGIEYLLMAMAGGSGHIAGALVGALLITLLKNFLQDVLPSISKNAGQLEIVVFGTLFILLMQYARGGLVPFFLRRIPKRHPKVPGEDAQGLQRRTLPAAGQPLLAIDGVTKRFGGLVAVDNVSFEVKTGEILGLIGPNGAGKSTMFNVITGVLKPEGGKVSYDGAEITGLAARRIAARGIARTFQHVKLRPNMTLLDNVVLGTYLRTRSGFLSGALRLDRREEATSRAEAMRHLRRVGLAERPYELAGNLPLGSQRILEVARALAADPALIILDEPAAGLRRLEKQALADMLRGLKQEGVTILLVEHDMDFVMGLVDRIVVMDFGAKLAEGLPAEIRTDPRVQQAYLGGIA